MIVHSSNAGGNVSPIDSPLPVRAVSPEAAEESGEPNDTTLRPRTMEDYVGQTEIKRNLSIFMQASKNRGEYL